jgi:hypothetical protein
MLTLALPNFPPTALKQNFTLNNTPNQPKTLLLNSASLVDTFNLQAKASETLAVSAVAPSPLKNRDGLVLLYKLPTGIVGLEESAVLKTFSAVADPKNFKQPNIMRRIIESVKPGFSLKPNASVFITEPSPIIQDYFTKADLLNPLIKRLLSNEKGELQVSSSVLASLTQWVAEQLQTNRLLFMHTNNANVVSHSNTPTFQLTRTQGGDIKVADTQVMGITSRLVKLLNQAHTDSRVIDKVLSQVGVAMPTDIAGQRLERNEQIALVLLEDATRNLLRQAINQHGDSPPNQTIDRNRLRQQLSSGVNEDISVYDEAIKAATALRNSVARDKNTKLDALNLYIDICLGRDHLLMNSDNSEGQLDAIFEQLRTLDRDARYQTPLLYDPFDTVHIIGNQQLSAVAEVLLTADQPPASVLNRSIILAQPKPTLQPPILRSPV